ncbi:response regulator [Leucobacter insecticola]|uniref:Transcriptional regulatory protein n=1 Tax=Leucobacter insecticola TaxID=2714934 RepID=A0A6G8FL79_9MICO|nr:response regulator [Leucobacter insecticola]QIM17127.1 response regulator [Leucobacter insecticola]
MTRPIRVLIVEDEPLTAEAHAGFLSRMDGFEVAGTAVTGAAALQMLTSRSHGAIDAVLLDMHLPDMSGIEVARRIRAVPIKVDIIAVTAARELETVRAAIAFGVTQYLLKPFTFDMFAEKLLRYRQTVTESPAAAVGSGSKPQRRVAQEDIDAALSALRGNERASLPKGLSAATLQRVVEYLRQSGAAVSAAELTEVLPISRITARRYLEYLTSTRQVLRESRYGTPGRPEIEYRWAR